ncbi:hypothetical protein ACLOJK_011981 [Asimina triloba]
MYSIRCMHALINVRAVQMTLDVYMRPITNTRRPLSLPTEPEAVSNTSVSPRARNSMPTSYLPTFMYSLIRKPFGFLLRSTDSSSRTPTKIQNHGNSPEPQSTDTRKCRPRMFYTCAVAILTLAHKANTKAEELDGPIGSLARRVASHAGPVVYPILYYWLEIFSFVDNQIISLQNATQTIFPPSTHVFNQLDRLVLGFENLPRKFEDAVSCSSMMVRQSPTLNWATTHLSMGIDFFTTLVRDWAFYGMKEKEIAVDVNYNAPINETSVQKEKPRHSEGAELIEKQNTIEKWTIVDDQPRGEGKGVKKKKQKKKRLPRACDIEDMKQVETTCMKILDALEKNPMVDAIARVSKQLNAVGTEPKVKNSEEPQAMVRAPEVPTQLNACGSEHKVKNSQSPILHLFHTGWHSADDVIFIQMNNAFASWTTHEAKAIIAFGKDDDGDPVQELGKRGPTVAC